jgi:hypothetical protein
MLMSTTQANSYFQLAVNAARAKDDNRAIEQIALGLAQLNRAIADLERKVDRLD